MELMLKIYVDTNLRRRLTQSNETVTFLGMEDVSESGTILNRNIVPFRNIKKGLTYFEKDDVLVAKITPCFENGKGACLDTLDTQVGFGSTEFHVLRVKKEAVPRYVFYLTQSECFRKKLETEMVGTAGQKRVQLVSIINYPLTVYHTKEEQQAIAAVLNDTDALISSLDRLIAKKRDIKQATMQQLLTGKMRLPGFAGDGSAKLGDFFELNPSKTYLNDTDLVTFIRMEDISESGCIINQNIMPLSSIKKGLTFFERNDVLVAKITPCFENGKGACLDTMETKSGFGSTEFHVLRVKKNAIPRYIFYQTQTAEFRQRLEAEMIGTAGQKRVPARAIINYSLPMLHSKDEQQAIAAVLTDMDAEIATLEQQRDKTRALKQGMMQELLTGKTRLV